MKILNNTTLTIERVKISEFTVKKLNITNLNSLRILAGTKWYLKENNGMVENLFISNEMFQVPEEIII